MNVFDRHVGKGKTLMIDGDEFTLLPLTVNELPLFFKLMKSFKDFKADTPIENALEKFDEETTGTITKLITLTLEKSYPEEDRELLKRFGLKHMSTLLNEIIELNMDMGNKENSKEEKIKKFIEQQRKKVDVKSITED